MDIAKLHGKHKLNTFKGLLAGERWSQTDCYTSNQPLKHLREVFRSWHLSSSWRYHQPAPQILTASLFFTSKLQNGPYLFFLFRGGFENLHGSNNFNYSNNFNSLNNGNIDHLWWKRRRHIRVNETSLALKSSSSSPLSSPSSSSSPPQVQLWLWSWAKRNDAKMFWIIIAFHWFSWICAN